MHCAWLPLLKHFTNGINVLSTLVLSCANWERREKRGDGEGWSWAAVESKQMALVLLSAWPSGVYLNWWLHHQTLAHQPTMALTTHIYTHFTGYNSSRRVSVLWWSAWEVYACVRCVCVCLVLFGTHCLANTHKCVYKYQACKNVIPLSLQSSFRVT